MTATTKPSHRGMWTVLAMTGMCMTMVAYNTTALVTVLPIIKIEFDLDPAELQWVMAIYTVSGASLMAVMGSGAEVFGKLRLFGVGLGCFGLGSFLAILATNIDLFLAGRMVQGVGVAALFGTSLSLLNSATPESHRPFVLGLWGAVIALGMSLGPIIGGAFGHYLSWRWIFYLNFCVVGLAFILLSIVNKAGYVPHNPTKNKTLDYPGAILLFLLLAPLIYGLSNSEQSGWANPVTLGSLGLAIFAVVAFIVRERRVANPLLHLEYFRHPRLVTAALGTLIAGFVLLGFFFYFNLFVQSPDSFGMTPMTAGAAVLPLTAVMLLFSIFAPRILGPYSYRWPITTGMLCLATGCYLLTFTFNTSTYSDIWWKLLIVGMGLGLTIPLLPRVGMRVLAEEHSGQGSGIVNTSLNFGATMGAVLCGIAHIVAVKSHLGEVLSALPVSDDKREHLVEAIGNGSNSEIQATLASLDPTTSQALTIALRDVQDDAFQAAMMVCTAVAVLGAFLACYLLRAARHNC